ncbi:MAG TPA: MFS transporter [Roseiflexaceae bacterium]|nr:MFS transporter [Roseiflexaceae bacterium]
MASTTKPDITGSSAQPQRTPALAPFRSRDFSLLWFGSFVSQAGSQMHVVAVSWQIYELTKNPLALGAIGVARIVPLVLLALGSGVLADALDRRKLMLFSQIAMMLCSAALAAASSLGIITVWWIYIVTALSSAAGTLGMPARQAIVPSLVPREQLSSALSLNIISWQAATIMGPTLGGLIIAGWGVSWVYWIDAASFLAVIAALLVMRVGAMVGERRPVNLRAALEGFAFVRSNTLIWSTMLLDFLATFLGSATVLLPLFATDVLKVGPQGVGLLYAAPSIGAVAASAILSVRGPMRRQGPILLIAVALYGLCTAIFGLSSSFWLSLLMLIGVGASDTVSMVVRQTIRQLTTPDEMRGRMTAVGMLFFAGGPQLGEIEAGVAARLLGGPLSVAAGGLACVLMVGILSATTPGLRTYNGA